MDLPIFTRTPSQVEYNLQLFFSVIQENLTIVLRNVIMLLSVFIRETCWLNRESKIDWLILECLQKLEDICSGAISTSRARTSAPVGRKSRLTALQRYGTKQFPKVACKCTAVPKSSRDVLGTRRSRVQM
jgi:hypothetical protein